MPDGIKDRKQVSEDSAEKKNGRRWGRDGMERCDGKM